MLYKKLAELYEDLSSTTKRLEKISSLGKFLRYLPEPDRDVLYLLLGEIYPDYDERRIGISSQLAIKAISMSTGTEPKEVVKEWKKIGDLGKTAEHLKKKKRQSTLQSHVLKTEKVLENLRKLPELEGKGTVNKKLNLITELLSSASPIESLYLIRTLIGDLRIGIKESTIRDAMAEAFFSDNKKEASAKIQEGIDKTNDIAEVFDIAKKEKLKEFDKLTLQVGKPIKVMLADKVKTIEEGLNAVGKPAAVEFKYDGFRMLIHKKGEEVSLYTRMLENVTNQFPEVVDYLKKYVAGRSFILDSEAVGYDKKTKEYKPFQEISQRIRRKYNIEKLQEELPVEVNVFDIIYHNGKSLLNEPFEKRTKLLRKIIKPHKYKIVPSRQIITSDAKKAEAFYKEALKEYQEGIMMKNLHAHYNPGRRVGHMLKLKPEERDYDLTIIGGEYGTGKRSGWLSSFILACKNEENGKFIEVGKVSTGIKEKSSMGVSYDELTKKIEPLIKKEEGKKVEIKPKIVVSVTYQEIQRSPNYASGFALRFPRFTELRPDKPLSEITTLKEIKSDYEKQKRNYRYG